LAIIANTSVDKGRRMGWNVFMHQDITTVNISLPKRLRAEMERKIARESYGSVSEYLRDLIRRDLRARAIEQVDKLLLEGLNSPVKPYNRKWIEGLKAEIKKALRPRDRRSARTRA
jgi:antitoxin ParD1/3/4